MRAGRTGPGPGRGGRVRRRAAAKTDEKEKNAVGGRTRTRTVAVSICRATDLRLVDLAVSLSVVHPSETTTLDGRIIMQRSATAAQPDAVGWTAWSTFRAPYTAQQRNLESRKSATAACQTSLSAVRSSVNHDPNK